MKLFLKTLLILLSILFIFTAKNPYYLKSSTASTIISRHSWQNFENIKDKKILSKEKIKTEFKATQNRLGSVEIKLDVFSILEFDQLKYDTLIFKIRKKGDADWYYQGKYSSICQPNAFYPFGFPIIEDSKGKIFEIELESVSGTKDSAFSLNSKNTFFLSKYSFPLSYLKQNQNQISSFIMGKFISIFPAFLSTPLVNYLSIVFLSLLVSISNKLTKNQPFKKLTSPTQTLFFTFFNSFWVLVLAITLSQILFKNSESLEWTTYMLSSALIIPIAFGFNLFQKSKLFSEFKLKKILNIYFILFSSFIFLLLLNQAITIKHLLFLGLAFLPLIKKPAYPAQVLFINLIAIISVLGYFNLTFPALPLLKTLILLIITIFLFFFLQSRLTWTKLKLKIHPLILLLILLPLVFYLTQKPSDYHHHILYLGPAFDAFKGKSLLGATPSLYGYLSIHFVSLILSKIGFSFANFNLLNTLLFTIYYLFAAFILLRLIKNKIIWLLVVLVFITLQTVFSYHSVSFPPSVGPMRFGLSLLIIGILSYLSNKKTFIIGSILASIALFWSAETAAYVVPAWLITLLASSYSPKRVFKQILKTFLSKLTTFGIFTLIIFSTIVLKEYFTHQTFPKIINYFDYVRAIQGGVVSIPITFFGNYYPVIIIMVLGVIINIYLLASKTKTKLLPLLTFISIHNLAIFSYFIGRSHENNIINLTGFIIIQLIIILKIFIDVFKVKTSTFKSIVNLPIILFFLLYIFRLSDQLIALNDYMKSSFNQNKIDWFKPEAPTPILKTALASHDLEDSPIVLLSFENDIRLLLDSNFKNELPLNPAIINSWLPPGTEYKYIDKSINELKSGTVVFVHENNLHKFLQPVFGKLRKLYALQKIGTIPNQGLVIYQIKKSLSD